MTPYYNMHLYSRYTCLNNEIAHSRFNSKHNNINFTLESFVIEVIYNVWSKSTPSAIQNRSREIKQNRKTKQKRYE